MGKATGTVDYDKAVRRMAPELRRAVYQKFLDGQGGQPGLEEQVLAALSEYRAVADMVAQRSAYVPLYIGNDHVSATLAKDLAEMHYLLYTKKERLDALTAELLGIQDYLEEIAGGATPS